MKLRDLIACAIEYEPLQDAVARRILQNILRILSGDYPKGLPP